MGLAFGVAGQGEARQLRLRLRLEGAVRQKCARSGRARTNSRGRRPFHPYHLTIGPRVVRARSAQQQQGARIPGPVNKALIETTTKEQYCSGGAAPHDNWQGRIGPAWRDEALKRERHPTYPIDGISVRI